MTNDGYQPTINLDRSNPPGRKKMTTSNKTSTETVEAELINGYVAVLDVSGNDVEATLDDVKTFYGDSLDDITQQCLYHIYISDSWEFYDICEVFETQYMKYGGVIVSLEREIRIPVEWSFFETDEYLSVKKECLLSKEENENLRNNSSLEAMAPEMLEALRKVDDILPLYTPDVSDFQFVKDIIAKTSDIIE